MLGSVAHISRETFNRYTKRLRTKKTWQWQCSSERVRTNNSGQFEGTAHEMWGFEAKGARKFTRTLPRTLPWNLHYHAFSAPEKKTATGFCDYFLDSWDQGICVLLLRSQGCLQMSATPRVESPQFFRWKMPFAVFRSGSRASESPLPPVQQQDAQHKLLQHKGAHTDLQGFPARAPKRIRK